MNDPGSLANLNDIVVFAPQDWWPPAPGWWLLAVAALIGVAYLLRALRQANQRRRPIRRARILYSELHANYTKGLIDGPTYLHEANELLKRLFIHGLGEDQARSANDEVWLTLLDERHGSTAFSSGPGRQLGNQRFGRTPEADPELLHPVLTDFLKQVRP